MVRSLLLTIAMLFFVGVVSAQTVLKGTVTDIKGETLIGATIKVMKGTDIIRGSLTDFDGKYSLQLDPGSYDLEVSYTGYQTARTNGVQVLAGKINELNFEMSDNNVLNVVTITAFKVPLIEKDKTSGGQTLTSEQIKNLPTRSVNAIVASTAGTTSIDGGAISIKGSRSNATNYYIDGVRVSGAPPPVQDIEQLSVITGGLGAEYGDVTGGVISVITKGPASSYHGSVEVENSRGLDPYGWLLATANVSGPILKRKTENGGKTTLLGFRLSGQYNTQKDDDPPALPAYYVKESVLKNLEAHPLVRRGGNIFSAAESLNSDSVDIYDYRPFEGRKDLDLTGKLDFRFTDNIDFAITGTYRNSQNQFNSDPTSGTYAILNAHNNPTQFDQRYRAIARLRHRLGSASVGQDKAANRSGVSNAYYQLQFAFERGVGKVSDPRHGDNFFDYGYVGRFDQQWTPFVGDTGDGNGVRHIDFFEQFLGFQPGYVGAGDQVVIPNPVLTRYNEFPRNPFVLDDYVARNGIAPGSYDDVWSNMFSNVGKVYNRVNRNQSDIVTITANSGFDVKVGKSGTHSIQFGILQEQRVERDWNLSPYGLWDIASRNANQFSGLTDVVIDSILDPQIGWIPVYAPKGNFSGDYTSQNKIREKAGLPYKDYYTYMNINAINPNDLSLDMFASRELTEENLLNYYGYDYTGQISKTNYTFEDFFKHKTPEGIRDFPVAPLRPLYQAAFVKDKFQLNEMIFSLGLRVERFDLNTQVMKDPYSLYEVINAREFHSSVAGAGLKPSNIGDDFKVYTTAAQGNQAKGYRNGDTWYFADGTQANDGNLIFGGGVVNPYIRDVVTGGDIRDPAFDYRTSFEDYKPQLIWLPRLAFSLPISEVANFFAHYDVLVQRPPDNNWQVTPLNYFNFYVPDRTPTNNANLKPERVVDYEVGYQQKLNENSALKFSAYYREQRDMVQERTILYVPTIGRYNTFGNSDFGTVKGFTWQYDLRRTGNLEMRLAYTLQFADGTGSNSTSQRGLTTRGNIRNLFPLSFDERHNLAGQFDYRYGSGGEYNGPRISGVDILSNFGINVLVSSASGRPYTANVRALRFGSEGIAGTINGSRLPWRFNADLRIDKTFELVKGKNPLSLNVYFRVANLLNARNIVGVYAASGSPTDDGYLASGEGRQFVDALEAQGRNRQSYLDAYSWLANNPNNFTQPRRMFVGAAFQF